MTFRGPLAEVFAGVLGGMPDRATALRHMLSPPESGLPVMPAIDRTVWDPTAGSLDRPTAADVLRRAMTELGAPWPQPLASQAARVHRDGDREAWESSALERTRRLSRAAVAAALTLDDRWVDEVADGVVLLLEQSSWCWPAHDDAWTVRGEILATTDEPFLDLGAGEVVAQLAWVDHLLGTQLDVRYPGLRARMRREAHDRVLVPFVARRDWHWLGLDGRAHNWSAWIHGNVLVAALRLVDGPEEIDLRARIVDLVIEGIDRYLAVLPADGAIDEGPDYWWNGACRVHEALDLLAAATGGALDAAPHVPALRATVAFPHAMHLGGRWQIDFADSSARLDPEAPWHALHRAAVVVGDPDAQAYARSHRIPGAPAATERHGLGRLLSGMTDPAWSGATPADPPLVGAAWFGSIQVMVARQVAGSRDGLALAIKGGHNDEHHNHNDVGSFIVASDGVPVVVDAGRPTYTLATFDPARRYSIWTMQSTWHGVPEIRGLAQSPGRRFSARDVECRLGETTATFRADLATAYPISDARWTRTATLAREPAPRILVQDAWSVPGGGGPNAFRLVVAGDVALREDGAVVTPIEPARRLRLSWPVGIPVRLTVRELDDPMLNSVWGARLTRIDLDVGDRQELTVGFTHEEAAA